MTKKLISRALVYDLIAGFVFVLSAIGIGGLWETMSANLLAADISHTVIGTTICFIIIIIISLWR